MVAGGQLKNMKELVQANRNKNTYINSVLLLLAIKTTIKIKQKNTEPDIANPSIPSIKLKAFINHTEKNSSTKNKKIFDILSLLTKKTALRE